MNLVNIVGILAAVTFVWSAVILTFFHIGCIAPDFSVSWQALMLVASFGITGIICYLACVPFMLVDRMEKRRKIKL